jgi:hypothetical protein
MFAQARVLRTHGEQVASEPDNALYEMTRHAPNKITSGMTAITAT